jgi:hypothetical protein
VSPKITSFIDAPPAAHPLPIMIGAKAAANVGTTPPMQQKSNRPSERRSRASRQVKFACAPSVPTAITAD